MAVIPILSRGNRPPTTSNSTSPEVGKRGRKPRASTVELREKLEAESARGVLGEPPHYVQWLLERDAQVGLAMARTIVYRELKKYR